MQDALLCPFRPAREDANSMSPNARSHEMLTCSHDIPCEKMLTRPPIATPIGTRARFTPYENDIEWIRTRRAHHAHQATRCQLGHWSRSYEIHTCETHYSHGNRGHIRYYLVLILSICARGAENPVTLIYVLIRHYHPNTAHTPYTSHHVVFYAPLPYPPPKVHTTSSLAYPYRCTLAYTTTYAHS